MDSTLTGDRVRGAIDELAEAEAVTVIVGAGASYEAGLPDWSGLVRELLQGVGQQEDLDPDDCEAFCDWIVQRDGLPAAGAVAKVMLRKGFMPALRRALYKDATSIHDFVPGQTAQAAAAVRVEFLETDSEIVTTNYDTLLEDAVRFAIEEVFDDPDLTEDNVVSSVSDEAVDTDQIVVRHLHGILQPNGRWEGEVVLSEADYHLMQEPESWQEGYFEERLGSSTCLFAGTSLSDPNLLRYLYRTSAGNGHVACFARQQDSWLYEELNAAVVRVRERAAEERWRSVGVDAIHLDYFGQVAQLLFEVSLRRRLQDDYVSLWERLIEWEAALGRSVLSTRAGAFGDQQDELQTILQDTITAVRELLADAGFDLRRKERLSCSLWVHQPSSNALVNWASSDRVWRDPRTMEPVPLEWSSPFVSVQAFCSGSVVSYSTAEQAATRWNHVVGAPLYLDPWDDLLTEEERGSATTYGRLPVGVITLASTEQQERSVLGRAESTLRNVVLPRAVESLARLLLPADG